MRAELAHRGLAVELAAAPETHAEVAQRRLVTLRTFRDMPEALLAKAALDSADIESFLADDTTIRMNWLWSNALGGIRLCVRPEDAESATQLLDQRIPEAFSVEGVGEFEQPRCPKCHSVNLSYQELDKKVAYVMPLAGIPVPLKHKRWRCESCGYEWRPVDEPTVES